MNKPHRFLKISNWYIAAPSYLLGIALSMLLLIGGCAKKETTNTPSKIPLTIGFANLSGADFNTLVSEDEKVLSPLFARSKIGTVQNIPSAEVLFVYAHLNEDGTIKGVNNLNIRKIIQDTHAQIVVLATANSVTGIKNAVAIPGPKTANIVFTLDRKENGFSRFFQELFVKMQDGTHMLSAWTALASQNPQANHAYIPVTILLAEGGKLAFPR